MASPYMPAAQVLFAAVALIGRHPVLLQGVMVALALAAAVVIANLLKVAALPGQWRYRELLLFVIGINTVLRISDLLELRVDYFLEDHQGIKHRFDSSVF